MQSLKGEEKPNRYVHIIYTNFGPGINNTDDSKN